MKTNISGNDICDYEKSKTHVIITLLHDRLVHHESSKQVDLILKLLHIIKLIWSYVLLNPYFQRILRQEIFNKDSVHYSSMKISVRFSYILRQYNLIFTNSLSLGIIYAIRWVFKEFKTYNTVIFKLELSLTYPNKNLK